MGGFIKVEDRQYRDDLYVYSFNGDCVVVNHVDLEKYVAGLLNSEMNASWKSNVLMAQAIAARTYAIYQMQEASTTKFKSLKPPFDLNSSVKDQVYAGAHQERYNALRAVQATRGLILTYQGQPIKSFYHSTCGGHTESPEKVWGQRFAYLKPVKCGFCEVSPRFNWIYDLTKPELEARLRRNGMLQGSLVSMRILKRNSLGRADRVEVKGSAGTKVVSAIQIRDLIGTQNVRSTDFNISEGSGKIVFVGHGSGHGVGMCQWGAKNMADHGYSYTEILSRYYPAANLTRIY